MDTDAHGFENKNVSVSIKSAAGVYFTTRFALGPLIFCPNAHPLDRYT